MGCCRESHDMERQFDRLVHQVRSTDKLLWNYCGHGDIARADYPASRFSSIEETLGELQVAFDLFREAVGRERERALAAQSKKFAPQLTGSDIEKILRKDP